MVIYNMGIVGHGRLKFRFSVRNIRKKVNNEKNKQKKTTKQQQRKKQEKTWDDLEYRCYRMSTAKIARLLKKCLILVFRFLGWLHIIKYITNKCGKMLILCIILSTICGLVMPKIIAEMSQHWSN